MLPVGGWDTILRACYFQKAIIACQWLSHFGVPKDHWGACKHADCQAHIRYCDSVSLACDYHNSVFLISSKKVCGPHLENDAVYTKCLVLL